VRDQVHVDNASAASRRDPNGGAYGPNTCLSGYVWRAAIPGDVVCVTPPTRSQAASDNRLAAVRRNTLHTTVATYYKGDSPRYLVTTDHINLGRATVALYASSGARLATWSKAVVDDPAVPGGRLTLRSGVLSCYGQRNAYFKVRDPSSGRWSAPVYVTRGCVQID
jgi:hypothetical protein